MKKLYILCVLAFLAVAGYSQSRFNPYWDSIPTPVGDDTTVFRQFYTDKPWGISFDYKSFDTTNAVLDVGECPAKYARRNLFRRTVPDSTIFNRLDSSVLPYTMEDSTVAIEKMSYNFEYLVIKLTKNSVTPGLYLKWYVTREQ